MENHTIDPQSLVSAGSDKTPEPVSTPGQPAGLPAVDPLQQLQSPAPVAPIVSSATQNPAPVAKNSQHSPEIAEDVDLIEKEWVTKAKAIVESTKGNPNQQSKELNRFKADYLKKRYSKDLKVSDS